MRFYTNVQTVGDNVLLKAFEDGKRIKIKEKYKPTLYVRGNKNSKFRALSGEPLEPIQFDTMKEAREFVRTNEGVADYPIYGNTAFQYPFIAERYPDHELQYDMNQISIVTLDIECESEKGFPDIENPQERINVITIKDFRQDLYHVFTFMDGEKYHEDNYYKPAANVKHYHSESEEDMLLEFIKVWRKIDPDVVTGWNVRLFDIPYIYNRIVNVLGEEYAKKLSVWGIVQKEVVTVKKKDHNSYNIFGVSILDYYMLYIKNISEPRENYKLGYIAEVELGQTKLDWQSKYERMKDFYTQNFQMFVEYNIQDVHLPDLLEAKLKLIEQTLSVSYLAKCNYTDVMAQVRTWDTLIYNWLYQEGVIVPPKEHKSKTEKFEGAFVKEPIPGKYNWVVSFDVTSLYPSIIRALNIGPETKCNGYKWAFKVEDALSSNKKFREFAEEAKFSGHTLGINGARYWKDQQSFFSKMVETLFTNRKKYQGEMKGYKKELETCVDPARQTELKNLISKFDIKQKATKIMMNSLYGAFGSEFFRFYDLDNAEAVTLTGQFIIQFIERGLNKFLNQLFKTDGVDYIIAGDTDSVYVNLEPLVSHVYPDWAKMEPAKVTRFLDKVCKEKIEKLIEDMFADITQNFINGVWIPEKPILSMKREVIANPGIWTAKKHYVLKVLNSEGDNFFECMDCHNKFSGPSEMVPCNKCKSTNVRRSFKLKIMGMEMVKSSMPKITRDAMKKAVEIILDGTQEQLVQFVDSTRDKFFNSPAEVIACPRGVQGIEKYSDSENIYGNKTPLHTKGVLLYNWYVKEKGLQTKYPYISDADKIKYVYLKLPNPIREKAIAFPAKLPKEFGLEKYIDYQAMWDLTFISPLTKILDPIGWTTEKQYDMDRFFK